MFLKKNYILANELVQKMDIHIANISMMRKQFEDADDMTTILKMNNCNFIKTNSHKLPNNIRQGIACNEFTDMSNKLPCTFVRSEYPLTEKDWYASGVVIDKVNIAGKQFYVFSDEFVKTTHNKIVYILDKKETDECYRKGQIDGFIQAAKNKFITWY